METQHELKFYPWHISKFEETLSFSLEFSLSFGDRWLDIGIGAYLDQQGKAHIFGVDFDDSR